MKNTRRKTLKAIGGLTVGTATYTSVASAATRAVTVKNPGDLFNNAGASYTLAFENGRTIYGSLPDGDTDTWEVDSSVNIEQFRVESDKNPIVKLTTSGNSSATPEGRIQVTGRSPKNLVNAGYEMKAVGCIDNDAQPNLEPADTIVDCEIDSAQASGDEDSYIINGQISYVEIDPNEGYVQIDRLE